MQDMVEYPDFGSVFAMGKVQFSRYNYTSQTYTDPTWDNLLYEAELSIHVTEDTDHIFLEGCELEKLLGNGVARYKMTFGA